MFIVDVSTVASEKTASSRSKKRYSRALSSQRPSLWDVFWHLYAFAACPCDCEQKFVNTIFYKPLSAVSPNLQLVAVSHKDELKNFEARKSEVKYGLKLTCLKMHLFRRRLTDQRFAIKDHLGLYCDVIILFISYNSLCAPQVSFSYRTDSTDSRTILRFYSAQRLDLFAWCVRLSRLLVGFRTHFESLHFHLFHFKAGDSGSIWWPSPRRFLVKVYVRELFKGRRRFCM